MGSVGKARCSLHCLLKSCWLTPSQLPQLSQPLPPYLDPTLTRCHACSKSPLLSEEETHYSSQHVIPGCPLIYPSELACIDPSVLGKQQFRVTLTARLPLSAKGEPRLNNSSQTSTHTHSHTHTLCTHIMQWENCLNYPLQEQGPRAF